MKRSLLLVAACLLATSAVFAQKKVLDHDVYDIWPSIKYSAMSRDGNWLLYSQGPAVGDTELLVKAINGGNVYKVERANGARFSSDAKFVVAMVIPPKAASDQAKKDKKPAPKNNLAILDLATGTPRVIENVSSFKLAAQDSGWIAYTPDPPAPTTQPKPEEKKTEEPKKDEPAKKKDHAVGKDLVVLHLASGKTIELKDVVDSNFDKYGKRLLYTRSTKDGKEDGVYVLDLPSGQVTALMVGLGTYRASTFSDETGAIAFLTDKNDYKSEQPSHEVFLVRPGSKTPELVAKEGSPGLTNGWWIAPRGSLSFSKSGARLMFRTAPKAETAKKDETPDDEKVTVDIWNWKDPDLQTVQLLNAESERNRTYLATYDLRTGRLLQVETPQIRSVSIGARGDGEWAVGSDSLPYRQLISWDQGYSDYYLIDMKTGQSFKFLEKSSDGASLSPTGAYVSWWDDRTHGWYVMRCADRQIRNVSAQIPYGLFDDEDDHPGDPPSYGNAGWTKNDAAFLVYDKFDLWAVDPRGTKAPICVTDGMGRIANMRFRAIRLEREEDSADPSKPLYLRATDLRTMASGFYRDQLNAARRPERLIMADKNFGTPTKADDADRIYFTRMSFDEYPDIWVSDLQFSAPVKMTDANPLMREYKWGSAELVEFTSLNGQKLKGILRKPADFDPMKTYPMIVYFYENLSQDLHAFRGPGPSSGAGISPSFYTSRGYVLFEPDIPFKVGYPGQSAKDSILAGINAVVAKGFVDPKRIAIHGHSWGGYQTAYLVTQTDMFRCAVAGAAVSNMISAYGGIRWGSGLVRQMQYEKGQSRIGGSLWERPLQFIENSPIFWADKVNTPLLMIHNDADDAVPWYQSIEYFTALRRLGKPTWLLNYNGEFHGLRKRANQKDWSIRMQQFFDYYLKDGPLPKWMEEGIPATLKGKDLGLEPIKK